VALTYDKTNGSASVYYNGAQVGQAALGSFTPLTTAPLYFGERPGPGAPVWYSGLMDEISLYSRALAQPEIQAIYDAGSGGKCAY
jgi:hypothetical protein